MKTFNKVRFLESTGLLDARFNNQTLRFERPWFVCIKAKLIFLLNLLAFLKMFISPMFKREDLIQLYIGSVYNVFTGAARYFIQWIVSMLRI